MLHVEIKINGDQATISKLKKLGQSFYQFNTAMKNIGEELGDGDRGYFPQAVFNSKGSVLGEKWAPLSQKYRDWKAENHDGFGQNELSGTTRKSFTYRATATSVTIGNTNDPVFGYLQLGTKRMPARPMIGVNDQVRSIIRRVIEADVNKKIKVAGI